MKTVSVIVLATLALAPVLSIVSPRSTNAAETGGAVGVILTEPIDFIDQHTGRDSSAVTDSTGSATTGGSSDGIALGCRLVLLLVGWLPIR